MIEAYYINEGFKNLPRKERRELEREAKKQQERIEKEINPKQYKTLNADLNEIAEKRNNFTKALQSTKIHCPLLDKKGLCQLYEHRNHDCRIHGGSFDESSNEIVGCFRHKDLFSNPESKQKFKTHAIPSGHRYKEKNKLDSLLITHLANNEALTKTIYITTPYIAFLKDFAEVDWKNFFYEKIPAASQTQNNNTFSLIIDTTH